MSPPRRRSGGCGSARAARGDERGEVRVFHRRIFANLQVFQTKKICVKIHFDDAF